MASNGELFVLGAIKFPSDVRAIGTLLHWGHLIFNAQKFIFHETHLFIVWYSDTMRGSCCVVEQFLALCAKDYGALVASCAVSEKEEIGSGVWFAGVTEWKAWINIFKWRVSNILTFMAVIYGFSIKRSFLFSSYPSTTDKNLQDNKELESWAFNKHLISHTHAKWCIHPLSNSCSDQCISEVL